MILWKMRHPARHLKRNCRKSHRQQLKRETAELIVLQDTQPEGSDLLEDAYSDGERDWYIEALDYQEHMRQEHEDEMYEQDMATDDYRFRYRLGEYESWNDGEELGDYY